MSEKTQTKCPSCDGTGADLYDGVPDRDCQVCNGRGTVETKMVYRVARALARQDIVETENPLLIAEADRRWGEYVFAARAAIEAMRAITEDMEAAAVDAVPLLEGKEARWSWEAMIDAALKE